ncbi:MAG: beta-galactosidase [Burkholderiaceae bacterium]|jgi:hypothetical protein|nr:beta-galactosidase [Burkholderiaceae bacterium]
MHEPHTRRSGVDVVCAGLALGLLALLIGLSVWLWRGSNPPLLLAPAIGGLSDCLEMVPPAAPLEPACTGAQGSAAARIDAALDALGPRRSPNGHFELGYTLVVPLLNLFQPQGADWAIDQEAVRRIARTVRDVDRPVVLYLFSTHFSERAPIEPALAQDPSNLAVTPQGALPVDRFMGLPMYPWSIARFDNAITQRREQAIEAVTGAICALPLPARERVAGVNLLGEVHHLYPDFEAGMGYDRPYVVTDYSDASLRGFRAWLLARFGNVGALNAALDTQFTSFEQVEPPSGDIRRQRLDHFWQHIDAQAAGMLAVGGWVHDAERAAGDSPWVRIYLDGQFAGRVSARFARQDVSQARPDLGTDRVGWRYDLRHAGLPSGVHRIDAALERPGGGLVHLGTRRFAAVDRQQNTPAPLPLRQPLPPMGTPDARVAFSIDAPADGLAVFYNPLVPLWHEYRGQQVVDYIAHFDALLDRTCLAHVPHRTQQIAPAEGAGWDASRFAAGQSLLPFGHVQLGVNLYGEAAEGGAFFDWLARSRLPGYSVTEFHPLRPLATDQLARVLESHRAHGARTLSFFLHPHQPSHGQISAAPNPFALDADNPQHGSDRLYQAMREVLRR